MNRFARVLIVGGWFFLANQYIDSRPTAGFQAGPFIGLQACQIQSDRYASGLMSNNDPQISFAPGPCYSSNGFVKLPNVDALLSPTGKQVPLSSAP